MMPDPLFAPWRMQYIESLEAAELEATRDGCFLCRAAEQGLSASTIKELLIIHRDDHGVVLLNRYPYTSGHLLIAPVRHVANLGDLDAPCRAGLMELIVRAQTALERAYNPQGMNIGINLGRCAGAGLPGHLHVHIVPRWAGDTNFMQSIGQVRIIPQTLEQSHRRLVLAWPT
ncbi:MAG: HIT domain-containing protein [Phycisphaeraceae bacterium]|nr:HIT domain-containing protein [Phycisphaeraceae bacterium]